MFCCDIVYFNVGLFEFRRQSSILHLPVYHWFCLKLEETFWK